MSPFFIILSKYHCIMSVITINANIVLVSTTATSNLLKNLLVHSVYNIKTIPSMYIYLNIVLSAKQ